MHNLSHIYSNKLKLIWSIAVVAGFCLNASCSTVSVDKKNIGQAIINKRGNIVTRNALSNKTISTLVSVGVPKGECLDNFSQCLTKIEQGILDKKNRDSLALYAEVYLAKAKSIEESEGCVHRITRPLIDSYYANAPLTSDERVQNLLYLRLCNTEYRDHLVNAIKYSYAYLFYDQLSPDNLEASTKNNHLPNDLDIQTQDVYYAAANYLLLQLYSNRNNSQQASKVTSLITPDGFKETPTLLTQSSYNKDSSEFEGQIKLLNFTFPPIDEDSYFRDTLTETEYKKFKSQLTQVYNGKKENVINDKSTSIDLYLPNEPEYLQNTPRYNNTIDKLYPSNQLSFSGLNTISERDGFGISYVTVFDDYFDTSVKGLITSDNDLINSENPIERINSIGNLLVTGIIIPQGETVEAVLNSQNLDIKLYNPHHTKTVNILGGNYDLAANFSASYGIWLAENNLANVGYFNLLAKQQTLVMPQLYMLEPYDPNKRVIIMLHGLASSPATWVSITNDIFNDENLRDNYQVWQVFYPTNIPILENRYRIQELIETACAVNDPNKQHIASQNSVLIGHSMGAVIARMLVSDENLEDKFNDIKKLNTDPRLYALLNKEFDTLKIKNRLHLKKLDSVDTAIFISAPFRGTDFAERWFTRLLRQVVQLPIGFAQTLKGNLTSIATDGELTANPLGALYLQNGASQLSDQSSFMRLTADLEISPEVTYHSIIANRDSDLLQGLEKLKLTTTPQTILSNKALPNEAETVKDTLDSSLYNNENSENNGESLIKGDEDKLIQSSKDMDIDLEMTTSKEPIDHQSIIDANLIQQTAREIIIEEQILGGDDIEVEDIKNKIVQNVASKLSDGIVPYSSSHLEGAASETILSGNHGIHETPEAILTLRKILHKHLDEHPPEK